MVLLCFNSFAILLGLSSLVFVAIYPFAKRFTNWPQFFLGLAFSWGALMGWAAQFGSLSVAPVLIYGAAIVWTIGYDTIYAHMDKDDDVAVGIGSTALLFGDRTHGWLVALYGTAAVFLFLAFAIANINPLGYAGLIAATAILFYQIKALDIGNVEKVPCTLQIQQPRRPVYFRRPDVAAHFWITKSPDAGQACRAHFVRIRNAG